jgi:hypothetical protein
MKIRAVWTVAAALAVCAVGGFAQLPQPAQTFQIKDRNGVPVVAITNVITFRFSKYYNRTVPAFQVSVKNVSGLDMRQVPIDASILNKDGSAVTFSFTAVGICDGCDFRSGATFVATYGAFFEPWPYTPDSFDSIRFSIPDSWQSPEDERLAEIERAAGRARIRAACGELYRRTANKKIIELTVKEEQQIKDCRALEMYR